MADLKYYEKRFKIEKEKVETIDFHSLIESNDVNELYEAGKILKKAARSIGRMAIKLKFMGHEFESIMYKHYSSFVWKMMDEVQHRYLILTEYGKK